MRFGSDPRITIPASGFLKTPHSKALQKTALENFTSLSNIPLIAERRPDMTIPISECFGFIASTINKDATKTRLKAQLLFGETGAKKWAWKIMAFQS
jgi:hypothetical protein